MNTPERGFSAIWIIGILLIVLIGVGFYSANLRSEAPKGDVVSQVSLPMPTSPLPLVDGQNTLDTPTGSYVGQVLAGSASPLLAFNKTDYEVAVKSGKLTVLYFYANWCPICKAEFPVMQEVFNGLTNEKVVGFRVNYNDSETDADEKALAKEFGVGYQHTKVLVKDGARVLKSPESWNKERYMAEISRLTR